MANIIFFTVPLFGHVNYGLKLAKNLIKRGHRCFYFSGRNYQYLVEQKGVCFLPYSDKIEKMFTDESSTYNSAAMSTGQEYHIDYLEEIWNLTVHLFTITEQIMRQDIDQIRDLKPDCIVYDNIAIWGRWAADQLNIPCFSSGTPYCYTEKMIQTYPTELMELFYKDTDYASQSIIPFLRMYTRRIHRMFPDLPLYPVTMNFSGSGDYNFIYTIPEFQLHPQLIDAERNCFAGILTDEDDTSPDVSQYISTDRKNVYIALGTIYNNHSLYRRCIRALKDLDVNVILSIGKSNTASDFGPVPGHWHVKNVFPQIALLKHIDVFISHGGANSLREACHFGVPMVILPQTGDHFLGAKDVLRAGTGYVLEGSAGETEIREAVSSCLVNQEMKTRCDLLADKMRKAGGLDKVTEIIESYLSF